MASPPVPGRARTSLLAAEALARLRSAVRRLHRRWRRSLQLRVAVSTLVLSALVVGLVAYVLMSRVVGGLIEARQRSALAEAATAFTSAQDQASQDSTDPDPVINSIATSVAARNRSSDPVALVVLGDGAASSGRAAPDGVQADSVPVPLRAAVRGATSGRFFAYTSLRYRNGRSEPAIAVGTPIFFPGSDATYQMYYLFPLRQEVATISLVRRTVALASGALVLLLLAIAVLVTRQVVTPVRLAARTAERLSAGRLTERMAVRGEDDLAKLATSFNLMARNLSRQIEQLEELSRVQQRFVSDVSHELRTPLTTVRMAADVLLESRADFPGELGRATELLHDELGRFEALLADLLEISRYDAGAATLEAEPTDLVAVVRRAVDAVAALARRRGSSLSLVVPAGVCVAEVDPRRVDRVLRNLLVNAVEHGEGRPVVVTVGVEEAAVAIAVRDHGVGLAPAELTQVFERFWRADPARSRMTGGTGLGLAIALEDTRLHGGWLQVWGAPGEGAQFRLTLPRQAGTDLHSSPLPMVPADADRPGLAAAGERRAGG